MLTVAQLAPIKDRDPYLYETLTKIVSSVNATSQAAGVDPSTPAPAPTTVASINVQASNGWFDISVTDPSDSRPGLFYFAESDTTPAFSSPRLLHGRVAQFVLAARQSDALLARLFAIRRLAAVSTNHVRSAAHRGSRRRHDGPRSAAFQRKRRPAKRFAAWRQRLWHQRRLPHHAPNHSVGAGL